LANSIIFEEKNKTGIIILNRPEVLNALNLEMAESFLEKIDNWKKNKKIERILIKGNGKAFCAGGDIKAMYLSSKINNLKNKFLNKEYILNYKIDQFSKPYLSIWNGIVMGGGVGLSIYGNIRIATINTKFAMPETSIGFFPDVGGSFFLSKLPNNIGLFLALSGKVIYAKELIYLGLATHFVNIKNLNKNIKNYVDSGTIPISDKIPQEKSEVLENLNFIEENFNGSVAQIIKNLNNSNSEFGKGIYKLLLKKCPMSLLVTHELLNKAKNLSLKQCLEMEYQLSQKIIYRQDFNNGVKSVLIEKNNNPRWNPSKLNDIDIEEINFLFKSHIKPLNL
tara:strand:- start:11983 stop:12993 length:1011 start_codon:yes stop_codon:yes gene_type:complete